MSKRSRETSFSLSPDSDSAVDDNDSEDNRITKVSALTADATESAPAMQCSLPPHSHAIPFDSIASFEIHYQKDHCNRCSECSRNLPSAHLLTLHIDEHHNPLRAARESKGEKTYGCFVEDCEKLCSTAQKRKLHLIDKHMFPKSYNFRVVAYGIDKRTSMLNEKPQRRRVSTSGAPADSMTRHRRSSSLQKGAPTISELDTASTTTSSPGTVNAKSEEQLPKSNIQTKDSVSDLTDSLSALRFIPPSVRRQQTQKPSR